MCNSKRAFLSQFFGYQVENSGTMDAYERTANQNTNPIYIETNPYPFRPEMGFNGYRYGLDVRKVLAVYQTPGYKGILPIAEQPMINAPYPYQKRVVS